MQRPVVLLAGGRDKGTGYARLAEVLPGRTRQVVAYGEAGDSIAEALAGVVPVVRVDSMAQAFERAVAGARSGDAVLLAPACSSFDEFKNYEERGRTFKRLVAELGS
jgi:UDP-N-acetylmuramoylalanine--D-glutamate ligase